MNTVNHDARRIRIMFWAGVLAFVVFVTMALFSAARAQSAQETIEKTIGSLVVQNAQCSGQTMALQTELTRVKAELDALKAKTMSTNDPGNSNSIPLAK